MAKPEFRFSGVWDGESVVALVHDLDGFLRAPPEETICVYIHDDDDNGDRPQPVAKGDVTWQSVD